MGYWWTMRSSVPGWQFAWWCAVTVVRRRKPPTSDVISMRHLRVSLLPPPPSCWPLPSSTSVYPYRTGSFAATCCFSCRSEDTSAEHATVYSSPTSYDSVTWSSRTRCPLSTVSARSSTRTTSSFTLSPARSSEASCDVSSAPASEILSARLTGDGRLDNSRTSSKSGHFWRNVFSRFLCAER